MIERRSGVIVNIASVNGLAYMGNEAYSAGKAAMLNLTQSIAVRYGHSGVRCVAVAPGSIATPAWQERVEKEPDVFDRLVKWYPLRRIGTPEDVASAVLFLASDEASWITGTVLRVDGGLLAGSEIFTNEFSSSRGTRKSEWGTNGQKRRGGIGGGRQAADRLVGGGRHTGDLPGRALGRAARAQTV